MDFNAIFENASDAVVQDIWKENNEGCPFKNKHGFCTGLTDKHKWTCSIENCIVLYWFKNIMIYFMKQKSQKRKYIMAAKSYKLQKKKSTKNMSK